MHFAITSGLLIVCGIVNAVHHEDNQGLPEFNRMKSKRSVFNGIPYPYGYNVPIEPLDSYVDAYQPAGYWPYQKNSIQHWEIPATFPEPSAVNPKNRVHEYLVPAPQSDVVYRTLMQRASSAISSAADAPDRGGNVAIQLTANLVYGYQPSGYQPSDVNEPIVAFPRIVPASRFVGPFFDDSLQKSTVVPKNSAENEPSVIIVALSSSDSSEKDAIARDADEYDALLKSYHRLNQKFSSFNHDESSFTTTTTTTKNPFMVIYNKLLGQVISESASKATSLADSESSDYPVTTTTAVNPAENEIDAVKLTPDSELERNTTCEYTDDNIVNSETIEIETKVEQSNENESNDDTDDLKITKIETYIELAEDEDHQVEWRVTTEQPSTITQTEEYENVDEDDSDNDINNEWDMSQTTTIAENTPETTVTTEPEWKVMSVVENQLNDDSLEYNE